MAAINGATPPNLVFAVNGVRFQLSELDPSTTLLEFLRSRTRFKSVKLGCGEGGCGACVVLISKYDPVLDEVIDFTASSCLTLLCSIHGCSITTSEGFGNSKEGFHPIHERFAGFHATQCGFCTPGMCVSLFGALINAEKTNRPDPPSGFSKVTVTEAENAISGNLCRCTGYRSIADACKSFAADVDMEDLGSNSFWKMGEGKDVKLSRLPRYGHNHKSKTFPMFLKNEIKPDVFLLSKKRSWHNPTSLEELHTLLLETKQVVGTQIKLVVGNTGMGYYRDIEDFDMYVDLSGISELSKIRKDASGVEIGAAVTISKAIEALRQEGQSGFLKEFEMILDKIADHMSKIASGFIRNIASVGGNLVMAQKNNFPSDIATILLAVDAVVHIWTGGHFEWVSLEEFLERPPLGLGSVLLRVKIPRWKSIKNASSERRSKFFFETFRAAPRPLGNSLPYLGAAFLAEVSPCNDSVGTRINFVRLSFGTNGTKHAIRAKMVAELLVGKVLDLGILCEAVNLLKATVVPEDATSRAAYRSSLAAGFLYEFFNPFIDSSDEIFNRYFNGYSCSSFAWASEMKENQMLVHDDKIPTLLSSGKQLFQLGTEYTPIGEPLMKSGAALQASGLFSATN